MPEAPAAGPERSAVAGPPSGAGTGPGADGMGTSVRAAQAVGLLLGFYLCTLGTLAALASIDVALLLRTESATPVVAEGKVIGLTVVIAIPLVRGVLASLRRRGGGAGLGGVPVTPEQQPKLWARVRGLAEQVGTRPPAEIWLVPTVNAAVSEDVRLMGLLPGRRRMYVGVPLLIGLTVNQLDAVLAHELGHYSNRDVRLAPTTVRGREGVLTVARAYWAGKAFWHRPMRAFFTWYAQLYLRTSQSVSRHQELAADRMAARIAGRDHTAAALREIPALDAAYGFYLNRYAEVGWEAGLLPLPEEFYGGLYGLLSEPSRQRELDELRRNPPEDEAGPYDSHPPISERIAAIESLPGDGRVAADAEPAALTLLRGAPRVCADVAAVALSPEAKAKRPVDWEELARGAGRASLVRDAATVLSTASAVVGVPVPDLSTLLQAVEAGWLDLIADSLPKSDRAQQATGRVAREFARTAFRDAVTAPVLLALVDGGRARWTHSWSRTLHLEFDQGVEGAVAAALDGLVAETPDTWPLRCLLHGLEPALTMSPTPTGL
ncbi:M48 family metallopeptidase [Streptomyces chiangmaiensis]